MNGSTVSIDHVSKHFGSFHALDDVNFTIKQGEFFSLLGPSGCGKTTLLRIIAGFEFPDDGAVLLDDKDIVPFPANKRPCNTVFQSGARVNMTHSAQAMLRPQYRQRSASQKQRSFLAQMKKQSP